MQRRLLGFALFLLGAIGCSSRPEIESWRSEFERPRPLESQGVLVDEIQRAKAFRQNLDLRSFRDLCLSLVAENPHDRDVCFIASQAASDSVFLHDIEDKERRNAAAAQALIYSRRAIDVDQPPIQHLSQHAWAMGNATHVQPMFDRADHAVQTLDAIERVLAIDENDETALRTKSILMLRLATLPWIATLFASGAPDGDLDQAIELARRCFAQTTSVENRLTLVKALLEVGSVAEAKSQILEGLGEPDTWPRDRELRPLLQGLADDLSD